MVLLLRGQLPLLHVLQILNYLSNLPRESLQRLDFQGDVAAKGVQEDFLDFSQEVLDSNLFRLVRLHLRLNVEEGLHDGASLGVHFFLGDESLGGQSEFVVVLNVDHQEDGLSLYLEKTALI